MIQQSLFDADYPAAPPTEGIKYAGSKLRLLPQILWLAQKTGVKTVFDGFAGSTRVSQALAQCGYRVICNDKAVWSKVFGDCYLKAGSKKKYDQLISELNSCPPKDGWFTEFYGADASVKNQDIQLKRPWQIHNTRKLDGIREKIDQLELDPYSKAVALTSLIMALDKVDSTLGHFASYLRDWSPRSFKSMHLEVPNIICCDDVHRVTNEDVFAIAQHVEADLAYYDPPYGSNNEKMPPSRVRYLAYYHLWTTICLNDRPQLFGKVNRRLDSRDEVAGSVFEEFRRNEQGKFIAVEALHRLINNTNAKYIILSYSSGGRATAEELDRVMNDAGKILDVIELDYRRHVMADMTWSKEWLRNTQVPNKEFLFLLQKK
ncbi:MAG: DNA adenine methylase [Magnetococcales bacterium]|nr:DNA adenine methylase [Magnetococcales bacterium]